MQLTRVFASAGFALLAVLNPSARTAFAQGTLPTYGDLTAFPDPDATAFSHWVIVPTLVVPTKKLQKVINAQAGSANFVALSDAGPGLSSLTLFSNLERSFEGADGELTGSHSDLIVTTNVLNLTLGTTEGATLGYWTSASEGIDQVFGGEVTIPAEFKWEINQEDGIQVLKVRVRGSDGLRATLKAEIRPASGFRVKADPVPLANRYLSDGPGGSHPSFLLAFELDVIPVDPGMFHGFEAGEFLKLPGGKLPISEVRPGVVGRSIANRIDVE